MAPALHLLYLVLGALLPNSLPTIDYGTLMIEHICVYIDVCIYIYIYTNIYTYYDCTVFIGTSKMDLKITTLARSHPTSFYSA